MSVLNQSGEEQVECPLCMEPLEVDDLNFFPCTCGYQICRFCWHRIRTDENGLCPACRKAYSEDPADFIPLSQEQVAKLKAEKRQRDQQRKAKLSESRKHLASVRVVQRNLVFVVGLPMRLADPEVLKRHEYFGKFGKIHKVVINQSSAYAGSQGPSASAYVTYMKSDDALRAIQSVNNITIDGRLIKSSLGTTKYCSHFMKNQPCPKPDCMYLHDFGDPEASFTKEEMQFGKHQEYEKKLHEALLQRTNNTTSTTTTTTTTTTSTTTTQQHINNNNNSSHNNNNNNNEKNNKNNNNNKDKEQTATQLVNSSNGNSNSSSSSSSSASANNKENWPQLDKDKDKDNSKKVENNSKDKAKSGVNCKSSNKNNSSNKDSVNITTNKKDSVVVNNNNNNRKYSNSKSEMADRDNKIKDDDNSSSSSSKKLPLLDDNSSFFSHNSFQKIHIETDGDIDSTASTINQNNSETHNILTDSLPIINTSEDWAAAFGFNKLESSILKSTNSSETQHQQQQQQNDSIFFRSAVNNLSSSSDDFRNLFDVSKLQENILDALPLKSTPNLNSVNGYPGLEHNTSKFFMDFHMKNGSNGYNNGYYSNNHHQQDRLLLLQQKKLEEHFKNLSLRQNFGAHYNNSSNNGYAHASYHGGLFPQQQQQQQQVKNSSTRLNGGEDELDFDPFQETQKALADLMASEQNFATKTSRGQQPVNGLVHGGQSGGGKTTLPPPPPGFVQTTPHMNSFGSKILPFLNMSSNNQQISSNQSWSGYNSQMQQQQQQHKSINNCNDWKDFDSAIVTTSRHYPLNMPPIGDHFSSIHHQHQQQQQQQLGSSQYHQLNNGIGQLRPHEYNNSSSSSAFSNFAHQIQQQQQQQHPSYSNYGPQHQNLSWFTSELNSQISSPPGFRNATQTSKQQEC